MKRLKTPQATDLTILQRRALRKLIRHGLDDHKVDNAAGLVGWEIKALQKVEAKIQPVTI